MSDYFESYEHEVYSERIESMLDAGEFVPEGSLPNGWGEIRYPRKPDYPCKWVDNEWVRLTDEEIQEENSVKQNANGVKRNGYGSRLR